MHSAQLQTHRVPPLPSFLLTSLLLSGISTCHSFSLRVFVRISLPIAMCLCFFFLLASSLSGSRLAPPRIGVNDSFGRLNERPDRQCLCAIAGLHILRRFHITHIHTHTSTGRGNARASGHFVLTNTPTTPSPIRIQTVPFFGGCASVFFCFDSRFDLACFLDTPLAFIPAVSTSEMAPISCLSRQRQCFYAIAGTACLDRGHGPTKMLVRYRPVGLVGVFLPFGFFGG